MESLSGICSRLWDLDRNRMRKETDYKTDLQGHKLFSSVNMRKLTNIPTYGAFMQLLDNYESDTYVRERETIGKIRMSLAFLDRCLETDVMRKAHSFLLRGGLVLDRDKRKFSGLLYELWFKLHPRPSGDGTERSAFEHVFVGETLNRRVIGFHNWVQLYLEETKGNFIYDDFVPDACGDSIITIDFTWKNKRKTFGSFFIGTSPEFELAIYTVCFLAGNEDETMVTLGNEHAIIVTYDEDGQIGACYPKMLKQNPVPHRHDVRIPIPPKTLPDEKDQQPRIHLSGAGAMPSGQQHQFVEVPFRNEEFCMQIDPLEFKPKPNRSWCDCTIL